MLYLDQTDWISDDYQCVYPATKKERPFTNKEKKRIFEKVGESSNKIFIERNIKKDKALEFGLDSD